VMNVVKTIPKPIPRITEYPHMDLPLESFAVAMRTTFLSAMP
jgi:hypothetical protein